MADIKIPQGMRDLINEEVTRKRELQSRIEHIFQSFGFHEIMTPVVEYYETYASSFASSDASEMYKFFDQDGNILILREDMTVPIARVCASKFANATPPFRFFYTSDVFKVRHVFAGKRGEVTDCGIELIGLDEDSDIEVLTIALEVMKQFDSKEYQLEIGNAGFFNSAFLSTKLSQDERKKLANLIDRKSLVDLNAYLETLSLSSREKTFFQQLPLLAGGEEIFGKAKEICYSSCEIEEVERMETLYQQLKKLGLDAHVSFDFGKIPHLDYYTGIIFEGYVEQIGTQVLSGGRYDNLLKKFGRDLPACGFSVKIDYLLDVIQTEKKKTVQLYYPKGKEVEAIQKANELRKDKDVEMIPWNADSWEVRQ